MQGIVHEPFPIHSSPPTYTSFFQSGIVGGSLGLVDACSRWRSPTRRRLGRADVYQPGTSGGWCLWVSDRPRWGSLAVAV